MAPKKIVSFRVIGLRPSSELNLKISEACKMKQKIVYASFTNCSEFDQNLVSDIFSCDYSNPDKMLGWGYNSTIKSEKDQLF